MSDMRRREFIKMIGPIPGPTVSSGTMIFLVVAVFRSGPLR
jgi:hypothetical protein